MELEESGTLNVGSTTLDELTTGVEEATQTVRIVGMEVTDTLWICGIKDSKLGVMVCNQIELVEGVLEDIISFNAL